MCGSRLAASETATAWCRSAGMPVSSFAPAASSAWPRRMVGRSGSSFKDPTGITPESLPRLFFLPLLGGAESRCRSVGRSLSGSAFVLLLPEPELELPEPVEPEPLLVESSEPLPGARDMCGRSGSLAVLGAEPELELDDGPDPELGVEDVSVAPGRVTKCGLSSASSVLATITAGCEL